MFRSTPKGLVHDPRFDPVLGSLGPVNAATFADLNGDASPELLLACEWSPLRIFSAKSGTLTEWDPPVRVIDTSLSSRLATASNSLSRLSHLQGNWISVAVGDFDNDGNLDFVGGNWGRNTRHESFLSHPIALYHFDFDADGIQELIEAHFDPPQRKWVPDRQLEILSRHLSFLRGRFSSNRAYSIASVEEVLAPHGKSTQALRANWFDSAIFLNRTNHFEVRPLPYLAQVAPVFGLVASDLNGDGNIDLFLAQNFFQNQPELPRYDAGRGQLLQGDGRGHFEPVPGEVSGIEIYGEQRAAAACDYDHDGRMDLAVSQNAGPTVLLHNERSRPSLRVFLLHSKEDPTPVVGAQVRWLTPSTPSPVQELQMGGGYWSQNSSTLLVASQPQPAKLWVRWPGGRTNVLDVASALSELFVYQH